MNATQKAIVECAQLCERALNRVARNEARGLAVAADEWRERAEWWACQAFRELDADLAEQALARVAA